MGACNGAGDCLAVADFGDPCYSEGCSPPTAASFQDLEGNPCLVPWSDRMSGRPSNCDAPDPGSIGCPEICAQPPDCIEVDCADNQCQVEFGYADECHGTGGTGGAGGTGGNGGSGGAADCDTLNTRRDEALKAAVTCNPEVDGPQCSGTATVPDGCGCPVLVNEANGAAVEQAADAYDAWVEAGCGPYPCGAACFMGSKGQCDELTSTCVWGG